VEDKRIFDDFFKVDCNDCQHYWTDACDGVYKGSEKRCNSFVATRRVDIPEQIKWLRKRVDGLNWAFIFVALVVLIYGLVDVFGR
jgi:hypothetical protein